MRLDEILLMEYFPGATIGNMAADNIPAAETETDSDNKPSEERAKAQNKRKRKIRCRISRTKHRNRPWTREEEMKGSPNVASNDLGNSDAALHGIMRGSHPYAATKGI